MKFILERGDIFDLDMDKYVLAHCISLDCKMGAGIAVAFNKKFPMMQSDLLRRIKTNKYNYPIAIPYETGGIRIINLITKEKYWHKPTYKTIEKAINDMYKICKECNIKYLAMPVIGCGLDRLEWDKVQLIIKEKFKNLDIEIIVKYL